MFIFRCKTFRPNIGVIILLRASEVGSPIDHLGSRQRRDTGQGSSSPLTGGLDLTPTGEPPTVEFHKGSTGFEKYGLTAGPVLLRQGEPGTSQYYRAHNFKVWYFYRI